MSDSDPNRHGAVALVVRIFGMDEELARVLLRSAGGSVDLAIDAWLEAGEQMARRARPGDSDP
jgi:hypothetical protein